ncbi:MAG: insulinase family protein [Saprospiraceae bacterium]|nr:insulinase family protein [Saprospiraceae bacterium]
MQKLIIMLLAICSVVPLMGQNKPANSLKIDFDRYILPNGLQVVLHQDKSDPIVAIAILYHVGSNREKVGRTGFAHFFEHMLFQSSENVGKGEFFKKIEDLGGTFNGGTWSDGTIYYEVVPKDALEKILWMESDRMGFFINTVTKEALENEKQVVKNEKRQRVDNVPYGHTAYVIDKALYPSDHPYNWQVIGSLEDLQAAQLSDVKEFYEKWYGCNNATLVLTGDFESLEAKKMIEKYFGEIKPHPSVETIKPRYGKIDKIVNLYHEDNFAKLPELTMVYSTVEDGHPDSYALDYLGSLLTDGKRAPLYKELVEEKQLAPQPQSYSSTSEIAGKFIIKVRANDAVDLDEVFKSVNIALSNFEKNGIDDRDMERIKNSLETQFYGGISSTINKAFQLAQYNVFKGDPGALQDEIRKIQAVTKQDVMRVYEKYIKGRNYIVTSFVPKGMPQLALENSTPAVVVEEPIVQGQEAPPLTEKMPEIQKTPSVINRSVEPALGTTPTITLPKIWNTNLTNKLQVLGIENSELPIVEFSLRIKGGMLLESSEKIGVSNLITDIMMEGTKNKTPEELQDAIGQLGATINVYTNPEFIEIAGNCLSRNYDAVMKLVEEILLEPRWDAKEFVRLKQNTLTLLVSRSAQPGYVASSAFNKIMYGKDNILSNPVLGTKASVERITIDDLKNYYNNNFTPSLSAFQVAGAVSQQQVLASLNGIEKRWSDKKVSLPNLRSMQSNLTDNVYFIDIPDAKQSVVLLGIPALKGGDKDYFAATVVNQRLGDGSSGRLFQILREEKGYTYGAYSNFARKINQGAFVASANVRSNVTLESIQTFKDILNKYQSDFSQQDLDLTKTSLTKGNALNFETLGQKLGILQNITTYDLPFDYVVKDEKTLQNMSLADAKALIGKYIDPKKLVYYIVGDAKTQLPRIKEAGIGKVILTDKEGNLLSDKP